MKTDRWLLPEGIEEVLPQQAAQLEAMRRKLLDLYHSWGYDLVMPPMIEYLESLLTGTGNDLDLQTFKLTDQLTGRMMGIRADMTPQVARIASHQLQKETPTRLCYMGSVLHTRPDGFAGSRSPLQVGAELYGHAGIESDVEILSLMAATLKQSNIDPYVDLGHVGIYRGLVKQAGLDASQEAELFDALQRKAIPEIKELLSTWGLATDVKTMLLALPELNGGEETLARAKQLLVDADASVIAALDNLAQIAALAKQQITGLHIHYDLSELRGYNYHTGMVFAAYVPGRGQAIAQGGRYDDIGQVFGRARPATGFSTDLKTLAAFTESVEHNEGAIYAPCENDGELAKRIAELRQQGERVICALPGQQGDATAMGCDRQLVLDGNSWQVKSVS